MGAMADVVEHAGLVDVGGVHRQPPGDGLRHRVQELGLVPRGIADARPDGVPAVVEQVAAVVSTGMTGAGRVNPSRRHRSVRLCGAGSGVPGDDGRAGLNEERRLTEGTARQDPKTESHHGGRGGLTRARAAGRRYGSRYNRTRQ